MKGFETSKHAPVIAGLHLSCPNSTTSWGPSVPLPGTTKDISSNHNRWFHVNTVTCIFVERFMKILMNTSSPPYFTFIFPFLLMLKNLKKWHLHVKTHVGRKAIPLKLWCVIFPLLKICPLSFCPWFDIFHIIRPCYMKKCNTPLFFWRESFYWDQVGHLVLELSS